MIITKGILMLITVLKPPTTNHQTVRNFNTGDYYYMVRYTVTI